MFVRFYATVVEKGGRERTTENRVKRKLGKNSRISINSSFKIQSETVVSGT